MTLVTNCEILKEVLSLSEPWFPQLYNRGMLSISDVGVLKVSNIKEEICIR